MAMLYQFGDYCLDLETRKLCRDSTVVNDDEKVVQLLQLLCKAYPDVVDKQILMDSLWPAQVVTDGALSRLVSGTRKILGDSGKDQSYVKTVRSRGFRLNTLVEHLEQKKSKTIFKSTINNTNNSSKYKFSWYAVLIAASIFLGVILLKPKPLEITAELPLRVAVLPVSSSNESSIDEWLQYGVMSILSDQLGQYDAINTLPVASVITAMSGLDENFSQQIMGEKQFESVCGQLGCSHFVVIKHEITEDKRQNFSYQIIQKNSRSAINDFTSLEVMQTVDMLLDRLSTDLLPTEIGRNSLKQTYSENNKANRDYAIGVHELLSGDLATAKKYLGLALKREPDFFWAKAYLTEIDSKQGQLKKAQERLNSLKALTQDEDKLFFLKHMNSDILYNQAKLEESLAQTKELLDNEFVLGNLVLKGQELMNVGSTLHALNKPEQALIYLNQAMVAYTDSQFSPGVAKVHYNLANLYLNTDNFEQALVEYQKAREAFKRSLMSGYALTAKHRVATTNFLLGNYQNAKTELENLVSEYQALGDEQSVILVLLDICILYFETEDYDIALDRVTKLIKKLDDTEYPYYKNQALGIAVRTSLMLGDVENAEDYFKSITENQRKDYRVAYTFMPAFILHAKGEINAAVEKAKEIKLEIGEQWTDEHQEKLLSLEKSLAAGKILPVIYKN